MKKFAFRVLMAAALLALAACLASCNMGFFRPAGGSAGGATRSPTDSSRSPEGLYEVSGSGAISVIDRSKVMGAIVIPEEIGGVAVTSIGSSAFYACTGLASVSIPSSVTSIGSHAFYGCSGLTSIAIPSSVASIGSQAFSGCTGLGSVEIPYSVTRISSDAFSGCTALMSIGVDAGNASYRSEDGCLLSGDGTVFVACPGGLASVSVPPSVKSIGSSAFEGCAGLASVAIPSSVTSIGDFAFYGCSGLASVAIPSSVTSIGSGAFRSCSGLTSVAIPPFVTSIGYEVFIGCTGLTSIAIPSSVTSIGEQAFEGCTSLTSIFFAGTKSQWSAVSKGSSWHYNVPAAAVHCSDGDCEL